VAITWSWLSWLLLLGSLPERIREGETGLLLKILKLSPALLDAAGRMTNILKGDADMNSVTKVCTKCKTEKPIDEFRQAKGYRGGRDTHCKVCTNAAIKDYRVRNVEKTRKSNSERQLKKNYGITFDEYDKMLERQGGVCATCGKPPNGRRLHVDHDHRTGKIRGLLCHGCNVALGSVDDNPSILQRLIEYLRG
jgi:hypothetical protein